MALPAIGLGAKALIGGAKGFGELMKGFGGEGTPAPDPKEGLFGGAIKKGLGAIGGAIGDVAGNVTPEQGLLGGVGLLKQAMGQKQKKKAEALFPQMVDPRDLAVEQMTRRKLRGIETGTASQAERRALQEGLKQGQTTAFRMGGKGLGKATRLYQEGILGLKQADRQAELGFTNLYADAARRISQRRLELGLLRHHQEMGQAQQTIKEGKSASGLALAKAVGIGTQEAAGSVTGEGMATGDTTAADTTATDTTLDVSDATGLGY